MKIKFIFTLMLLPLYPSLLTAQESRKSIKPYYCKLTTSNGLIVTVHNAKEDRIDYAYPHILHLLLSGYLSTLLSTPFLSIWCLHKVLLVHILLLMLLFLLVDKIHHYKLLILLL